MSTLQHLLKEANVPISLFCEKLGITEDHALEISRTADNDTQINTYWQFLSAWNDEALFPKLVDFYSPYLDNKEELASFVSLILKLRDNNIPRRMLNSIERLISLADDIEVIRPGQHCLKIFHFVVCIETIYFLSGCEMEKYKIVIDFFTNYVKDEDKRTILEQFRRDPADDRFFLQQLSNETDAQYKERTTNNQLTMEVFARVINEIRNCFAHEGNYWNFHFADSEYTVLNSLVVAENYKDYKQISEGKIDGLERVYSVDLTYDQFKSACVRGFTQFVKEYIKTIKP